ncbi:hypothetical protein Hanom_Chr08g00707981 [Helianthus anomalus]
MAFMCTMMANLLPSLATMDSKELLTNVIALAILVITLAVVTPRKITSNNVSTRVMSFKRVKDHFRGTKDDKQRKYVNKRVQSVNMFKVNLCVTF